MKKQNRNLLARAACVTLLLASGLVAQEHRWAGRTLDGLEWAVHERLATLSMKPAFETLDFEVQGSQVTLSGHVLRSGVKEKAERAVRQVGGVEKVVNKIEVLPASRRDDTLRMNVYRAIHKGEPGENRIGDSPQVHIIVKDGWVRLQGAVSSDSERATIHMQALAVTPHVSDELRVAPSDR